MPSTAELVGKVGRRMVGARPCIPHAHYSRHFLCSALMPALLFCRSSGALICRWAHGCPCASQHPRIPAIATCLSTASRRLSGGCESGLHVGGHPLSTTSPSTGWKPDLEVSVDGGSQHGWWKSAWMVLAGSCGATGKA